MRAVAGLVVIARAAAADPQLVIDHEPAPPRLHMRRAVAAVMPAPPPDKPGPTPAPPAAPTVTPTDEYDADIVRDVREPVSVRFSLGYQVDGTTLTGRPTLGGRVPADEAHTNRPDFDSLHAWAFGEAYLSTRGVGLPSLSTYFASHFQVLQSNDYFDPQNPWASSTGHVAIPQPIGTWFDRTGMTTYGAWAEMKDFLPGHAFAPLRVRAGELYIYGPWVLHMYGLSAAWEGKALRAEFYAGSRVPDYTLAVGDQQLDRAAIGGANLHIDLGALKKLPIVITAEALAFTRVGAGETQPSNHTLVGIDWKPRQDFALVGEARSIDGQWENEHVQFRARYRQVTNIVFDVTHRQAGDWRWDPSLVGSAQNDPLAPKRYLDLGPVQPQILISARAGTLIAENVDLYGRVAVSNNLTNDPEQVSSYSASYWEGGGALEVRLRRTLAVGISGLTRHVDRLDDQAHRIEDTPMTPDQIPTSPAIGERDFTEGGATLRLSLGARKLSGLVEVFGRSTNFARDYCVMAKCNSDSDTGVLTNEMHWGGRATIDAWIGQRLRLFASYELSGALQLAPEITGYKTLRLIMEGIY